MLHDLQFAFRQLLKSPGFSLVAILTLALAIGANTAIFSAIDAVLLHPLPYPDPDRLVIVQETLPRYALHGIAPTAPDYAEFRRQATCFSQVAAVTGAVATLTGDGQPEDVPALRVTASAFPMLGVVPVVGGLFTSDDDQPGRDHVAILSEGLWTRRYGRDPSIVGKNIQINLVSYRVAGVIRPILDYRVAAGLWMPLAFAPSETAPGTRSPHNIDVIGRLKPGGSIQEARDEFRRIAAFIVEQYPNQASMDRGFSLDLEPLAEKQAGDLKTPLLVLIVAVGALMVIACANVSNLLLARAMKRQREIAIRSALGASRLRLIRQLLTESLLLAFIAGAAGTLLALYGLRLYAQFGPADLIHGARPSINAWVMGFSLLVSIAASMLFGIAPALETSRIDVTEALKEGSRGSTVGRRLLARVDGRLRSLRLPGAFDWRRSLSEKLRSLGTHQSRIPIRKGADRVCVLAGRTIPGTLAKSRLRALGARTHTLDSGCALRSNDRFPSLQWRPGKWRSRDRRPSPKSK